MTREYETDDEPSVLASLRRLIPQRPVSFTESLRIAEQQAARLLGRFGIRQWPVPESMLRELPRIAVEQHFDLPTSGCSFWDADRRTWVIRVNSTEPITRQRFTLLHEYKHIVDHGRAELLYGGGSEARIRAEQTADFFAGCVLVPRALLKRAWGDGIQDVGDMAVAFDVSPQAVAVRLAQIGLVEPAPRCGRPVPTGASIHNRPRYQRRAHPKFPHTAGARL